MKFDSKYVKALVFSVALLIAVWVFRPIAPNTGEQTLPDSGISPDAVPQQSVIVPEGDLSDNYVANALSAKGELVKWQKLPISVFIQNNPHKNTVETAFNNYNNVFPGILGFSFTENPATAKIKVNFTNRLENANTDQFIAGLTNNYTSGSQIQSSTISILTEKNGRPLSSSAIYNTVMHEIGHSIGIIGHSQKQGDIMYSHFVSEQLVPFSQRDLATIKIMYSNNEALLSQSRGNAASEKLEEALKYAQNVPDKTVSWINLGNVYYDLKMLPEALESYKKALQIDPNDANTYVSMASCYYESKKYSTAATFYGYAIERSNDSVALENYEYMKALSLISAQNYQEAYNAYSSLITKYPNKKEYIINYLYACTKLNREEGKDVLISYLNVHPEDNNDQNLKQYKQYYKIK